MRRALVVANDTYEDTALARLRSAVADAEALQEVLGSPRIGGFEVAVSRNEAGHEVQARIEDFFAEAKADDLLLLYFSGHGLKAETGELFLAASNTRPSRLASSAVPAEFVHRCMRTTRSRCVVLFLDCCYGGAFPQGAVVRAGGPVDVLSSFPEQSRGAGRGQAVITASTSMEYSFEGAALSENHSEPSVFTAAFVEGLRTGDADRDADGLISLDELYDYLYDKVRLANPAQTPSRKFDLQGELHIAASDRRRAATVELPPDLAAAIADPNMFTRIGAVSELRRRLAGADLPTAAAALETLRRLVVNDIGPVADAAQAAIDDARISVEPRVLVLPEQPAGVSSVHELRLAGVPLALGPAVRVSLPEGGAAAGLSRSGDVLRVSVTWPVTPSEVLVEGPAGTLRVPVRVEPAPERLEVVRAAPEPEVRPEAGPRPQPEPRPQPVALEPEMPPSPVPGMSPPAVVSPFAYALFAGLWALGAGDLAFAGTAAFLLTAVLTTGAGLVELARGRGRDWALVVTANAFLGGAIMLAGLAPTALVVVAVLQVAVNTVVGVGLARREGTSRLLLAVVVMIAVKALVAGAIGFVGRLDGASPDDVWKVDATLSGVIAGCCVVAGVLALRGAVPAAARAPGPEAGPAGLRGLLLSPLAIAVFGLLATRIHVGFADIQTEHIGLGLAGLAGTALAGVELLTRRARPLPAVMATTGAIGLPVLLAPGLDADQLAVVSVIWGLAMIALTGWAARSGRPLLMAFCLLHAVSYAIELVIGVQAAQRDSWPTAGQGPWAVDGVVNGAAVAVLLVLWGLHLRGVLRRP